MYTMLRDPNWKKLPVIPPAGIQPLRFISTALFTNKQTPSQHQRQVLTHCNSSHRKKEESGGHITNTLPDIQLIHRVRFLREGSFGKHQNGFDPAKRHG